jgi:hypothetical protein
LLSASELQKRGHFVYSPSDPVQIPSNRPENNNDSSKNDTDSKDKTYRPPKRCNPLDNEAPETIYTGDGDEMTSETKVGTAYAASRGLLMARESLSIQNKSFPSCKILPGTQPNAKGPKLTLI